MLPQTRGNFNGFRINKLKSPKKALKIIEFTDDQEVSQTQPLQSKSITIKSPKAFQSFNRYNIGFDMMSAERVETQPKKVENSPPKYLPRQPKDSGVSEPTATTSNYLTFDNE